MGLKSIIWTLEGKSNLKDIFNFILKGSEKHAYLFINEILKEADNLVYFPKKGRKVPESREGHLEVFVGTYRLIYLIKGDIIYISAVIHMSIDFEFEEI